MAKIRHNSVLETIHQSFLSYRKQGVTHQYAEDQAFDGRHFTVRGKKLKNFGTTTYTGLCLHQTIKDACCESIQRYGTSFPLSSAYIKHPLFDELEQVLREMYQAPVVVTKNSSLAHAGVIPHLVSEEDMVLLDQQVHFSVVRACDHVKIKGVPVDTIKHNDINQLEDALKQAGNKFKKVWYMVDGVYSMYGDVTPILELMELSKKYPHLHIYVDDVHGQSWKGKHGTGFVMSELGKLPYNVILVGTLSKSFGANGAFVVFPDEETYLRVKLYGGPGSFSAQLPPGDTGAAIASAKEIHMTSEIDIIQKDIRDKQDYFNALIKETDVPLIVENDCPVNFICTGQPAVGANLARKMYDEGFYVNLAAFPVVAAKKSGLRVTIHRLLEKQDIADFVSALDRNYYKALEEEYSSMNEVRTTFKLPLIEEKTETEKTGLELEKHESISAISKEEWNGIFNEETCFNWDTMKFLEQAFSGNEKEEENYHFSYYLVKDKQKVVAATFFTQTLGKIDMLMHEEVSAIIEKEREKDPYYLSAKIITMGTIATEGKCLFVNEGHSHWKQALSMMLSDVQRTATKENAEYTFIRDFVDCSDALKNFFLDKGYVSVNMPSSNYYYNNKDIQTEEDYINSLSKRNRKHFRENILRNRDAVSISVKEQLTEEELETAIQLYRNVQKSNLGINLYPYPNNLFKEMNKSDDFEFILAHLDNKEDKALVGVLFSHKSSRYTPLLIGLNYDFNQDFGIYRQLLYQSIVRSRELNYDIVDFGFSADIEKRKLGVVRKETFGFVTSPSNYAMERLDMLMGQSKIEVA